MKCGVMLTINVPIMCYMSEEHGDKTVCNSCYMSYFMWRDDENTDNEEEITLCQASAQASKCYHVPGIEFSRGDCPKHWTEENILNFICYAREPRDLGEMIDNFEAECDYQ